MIQSETILSAEPRKKRHKRDAGRKSNWNGKLASMGKTSAGIINELHSPIDSTNRFINLALQTIGEDSQSRQFLLESKQGIRKTSQLLKRLHNCVKRIEKEIRETSERDG